MIDINALLRKLAKALDQLGEETFPATGLPSPRKFSPFSLVEHSRVRVQSPFIGDNLDFIPLRSVQVERDGNVEIFRLEITDEVSRLEEVLSTIISEGIITPDALEENVARTVQSCEQIMQARRALASRILAYQKASIQWLGAQFTLMALAGEVEPLGDLQEEERLRRMMVAVMQPTIRALWEVIAPLPLRLPKALSPIRLGKSGQMFVWPLVDGDTAINQYRIEGCTSYWYRWSIVGLPGSQDPVDVATKIVDAVCLGRPARVQQAVATIEKATAEIRSALRS